MTRHFVSARLAMLSAPLSAAALLVCVPVASSAQAEVQDRRSAAAERLAADREIVLRDGARFIAPRGWYLTNVEGGALLSAPEQDSQIVIVQRDAADPAAAVAAAWHAHRPVPPPVGEDRERPPREGWARTVRFDYDVTSDGDERSVMALALANGGGWTVLLYDVSNAVAERRDAQIEVILNSLLPRGYQRETFAGRSAHRLDQARINELAAMIETARREYNIPGVALGLIQDGEILFAGGFGVREAGRSEPVDADTLFNVASIGKAWTTLLLARQVAEGSFSWDSRVRTLWPAFGLGDAQTSAAVEVRHLVCACTGMPRNDYRWLFEGENATAQSIMADLAQSRPTSTFGDVYQYSNLMVAAGGYFAGHMRYPHMELGAAYDRALQELVFDPLQMRSTTPDFARALAGNHATGHAQDVDGRVVIAAQGLNLAAISTRPSGNHWSNVTDILRYIQMELATGVLPDGNRYIDAAALRMRAEPMVTEGLNEHYGMGLKIDRQWGVTVVHHGGTAFGYRSHMMWLPDYDVGAVILINSDTGGVLRTAFRRRLLELLFDGEPVTEADLTRFAILDRAAVAEERERLTVPADRAAAAVLATEYRSAALGTLRVDREGERIWFDFGGWRSEVASLADGRGGTSFITISPGLAGYVFEPTVRDGKRILVTREAQNAYEFEEAG